MYIAAASSAAGITTAITTSVIALTGLIAALAGFYKVVKPVKEIHEIVNSQRTEMRNYIKVLSAVLKSHAIDVPIENGESKDAV